VVVRSNEGNNVSKNGYLRTFLAAIAFAASASMLACGGDLAPGPEPATSQNVPVPASIIVTPNPLVAQNLANGEVTVTFAAITATGQAVPDAPLVLSADPSVSISPAVTKTDASGGATAKVKLLGRSNRVVAVTAMSGAVAGTGTFIVTGAALIAAVDTPRPAVGSEARVVFTLTDASKNPMPGQTIRITSSLNNFPPREGTTDALGSYTLSYTATNAGVDTLVAEAAGARPASDPQIQIGGGALPPPSTPPAAFTLQAQPATVDFNPSGNANRAQLIARVFDASNVPVQNAQVRFRIAAGQQFGALTTTDVVLTDPSGVARADFIAGNSGSAQDQIKVCAVIVNSTATPSNPSPACAATESGVSLTIRETAVSIVIGQSGKIGVPNDLSYTYEFIVQVARVGGAPVQGAVITVDPLEHAVFQKGVWSGSPRTKNVAATCPNEDTNRNDILEAGEDVNNNGRLDPRRPVNYLFVSGAPTTNADGQAIIRVTYPKSFGSWVSLDLSVRTTVGGSESRAGSSLGILPVSAEEIAQPGPAFLISPFGVTNSCMDPN
jgi:hypothetical protein